MLERFLQHISREFPFLAKSKLLIALSGGLDSVVLLHLCHNLQLDFSIAHCNYNLRDKESDGDEDLCLRLAEKFDAEIFIQHFDTQAYAEENRLSIQMAARELRYDWFIELADQLGFDYILTAHHADDNLETFLINLSRGSGLDGLKGIPQKNERLLRPLLLFSREEISSYALENNLEWREDSSNKSLKYLRNRIRQELVPTIKSIFPDILDQLSKTQSHLQDSAAILESEREVLFDEVVEKKGDELHFDLKRIERLNPSHAYLYLLLKNYGFTQWQDIYDLIGAQPGKQVYSPEWRLLKDRDRLILTPIQTGQQAPILISDGTRQITTSLGILQMTEVDSFENPEINAIYVDKDLLSFPLILRPWENGDAFFPIGMNGKKKISKYLKDEKISLVDKEKCRLLCSDLDIVWVVGYRADDRFKITESTRTILKIELQ